ncbi:MAG: MOSC domain-containing protein [Thermoleophilia bacterium]|nr:MOSC domain-containing protein [Thermoleophilia bacterium]
MSGTVETIVLRGAPGSEPVTVARARALAGHGLEGDRYASGAGTFSATAGTGRDLTLIEAEALDALAVAAGIRLAPGDTRRNVVTRGIGLNDLVGRRFRLGSVECLGRRLCDPCSHLEGRTTPGVLAGLAGRGGLRADILADGEIAVGDEIVPL